MSALFVADLIEHGAETTAIARALGWRNRQRVSERRAKAEELMGRPLVRPKVPPTAETSFRKPSPNSVYATSKAARDQVRQWFDAAKVDRDWWHEHSVVVFEDDLGHMRMRYRDPYVEENRTANPDTFPSPFSGGERRRGLSSWPDTTGSGDEDTPPDMEGEEIQDAA